MTADQSPPPFRELSPERVRAREEHLLDEIRIERRPQRHLPRLLPGRGRLLVAAAVLVAAIVAAPALAFSTTVREFVGLTKPSPPPFLVATITSVVGHKHQAVPMVTVTFTVGEHGKSVGTGVPLASEFFVFVVAKIAPERNSRDFVTANGAHGRYSATTVLPPGGIASIQIGGWTSNDFGYAAGGQFWLPVDVFPPPPSSR